MTTKKRHWLRLPGLGNNNEKLGLPERLSAGTQFRFRNLFHGKMSGNRNFIFIGTNFIINFHSEFNLSNLGWKSGSPDTMLEGGHPRTIPPKFGLNWLSGF